MCNCTLAFVFREPNLASILKDFRYGFLQCFSSLVLCGAQGHIIKAVVHHLYSTCRII